MMMLDRTPRRGISVGRARSVAVLALVGAVFMTTAAVPAEASASTSHYRQRGPSAQAFWTTCPDGPQPGVPCTETFLLAGETLIREDGTTWKDEFLVFEQSTQICDDEDGVWICRSLGHTSGFAGPGEVELSVDERRLATASVDATPLVITCVDRDGEVECGEWRRSAVVAAWTASGDTRRGAQSFHVATRCFVESWHLQGSQRPAVATGSLGDQDLGSGIAGQISRATLAIHSIRHTC